MAERRILILGMALLAAAALFLAWNLRQPVGFILSLRGSRLAALLAVGAATGAATVLFQTVAGNRLITPGIVGFDALFVFLQTALVLGLGGRGFNALPDIPKFLAEASCMILAATLLFGIVLRRGGDDILRLVLTGVVLGALLRGLASFGQRLLDPSDFAMVQRATFATFGAVNPKELTVAAGVLCFAIATAWRMAPQLDVAALGRTKARSLGLDHDRTVRTTLALVAAMISVSTALVGPVTFLGLLAASLAYALLGTAPHARLIPAAAILGALILVAGQFVFERVLGLQSTLAVIVEFAGGLVFLALVLRSRTP